MRKGNKMEVLIWYRRTNAHNASSSSKLSAANLKNKSVATLKYNAAKSMNSVTISKNSVANLKKRIANLFNDVATIKSNVANLKNNVAKNIFFWI